MGKTEEEKNRKETEKVVVKSLDSEEGFYGYKKTRGTYCKIS